MTETQSPDDINYASNCYAIQIKKGILSFPKWCVLRVKFYDYLLPPLCDTFIGS